MFFLRHSKIAIFKFYDFIDTREKSAKLSFFIRDGASEASVALFARVEKKGREIQNFFKNCKMRSKLPKLCSSSQKKREI